MKKSTNNDKADQQLYHPVVSKIKHNERQPFTAKSSVGNLKDESITVPALMDS